MGTITCSYEEYVKGMLEPNCFVLCPQCVAEKPLHALGFNQEDGAFHCEVHGTMTWEELLEKDHLHVKEIEAYWERRRPLEEKIKANVQVEQRRPK